MWNDNSNNNSLSWYERNSVVLPRKVGEKGTVKVDEQRTQRSIRVKREKWKTNGKKNKCKGNMSGT